MRSRAALGFTSESPDGLFKKLKPGPGRAAQEVADHQRVRLNRALIELVAEHGYRSVTVRELSERAGVSTRAFYENHASKDACFLSCHRQILGSLLGSLDRAAPSSTDDWRMCVRDVFAVFIEQLGRDPQAARFVFVGAYAAGSLAQEQARQANELLLLRMGEGFGAGGAGFSHHVIDGIAAGAMSIARSLLVSDQEEQLRSARLIDRLTEWAISSLEASPSEIDELDHIERSRNHEVSFLPPIPSSDVGGRGETDAEAPSAELTLLLSATTKLVIADGYEGLSLRKILATAGVSRRSFFKHFSGVENCYIATQELQMQKAILQARQASAKSRTSAGGMYRAVASLCDTVAQDSAFACLCFGDAVLATRIGHCKEPSIERIERLVEDDVAFGADQSFAREASVGALWGLLHKEVSAGRARQAPSIAATLSYLLLAPTVGASAAIGAMREEHMLTAEA